MPNELAPLAMQYAPRNADPYTTPGFVLTPTIAGDGIAQCTVGMSESRRSWGCTTAHRNAALDDRLGQDGVYPGHTFIVRRGTPVRVK